MKILVVDDEMVSREKMKMIMSHFGECEAVESGADAVEKFVGAWNGWTPYDLISLDVQMPEMDGVEVLNRIRGMEREKNVPESKRVKVDHGDGPIRQGYPDDEHSGGLQRLRRQALRQGSSLRRSSPNSASTSICSDTAGRVTGL